MEMGFEISWATKGDANSPTIPNGVSRVLASSTIEALEKFYSDVNNHSRIIVGLARFREFKDGEKK